MAGRGQNPVTSTVAEVLQEKFELQGELSEQKRINGKLRSELAEVRSKLASSEKGECESCKRHERHAADDREEIWELKKTVARLERDLKRADEKYEDEHYDYKKLKKLQSKTSDELESVKKELESVETELEALKNNSRSGQKSDREKDERIRELEAKADNLEIQLDCKRRLLEQKNDQVTGLQEQLNAQGCLEKEKEVLQEKLEEMTILLAEKTREMQAALTAKTSKMNTKLAEKTWEMNSKLEAKTREMQAALAAKTSEMNTKLAEKTWERQTALDAKTREMNIKLVEKNKEMEVTLAAKTREMQAALEAKTREIEVEFAKKEIQMEAKLGEKRQEMEMTFANKAREMDMKLVEMTREMQAALEVKSREIQAALAAKTKEMKVLTAEKNRDIKSAEEIVNTVLTTAKKTKTTVDTLKKDKSSLEVTVQNLKMELESVSKGREEMEVFIQAMKVACEWKDNDTSNNTLEGLLDCLKEKLTMLNKLNAAMAKQTQTNCCVQSVPKLPIQRATVFEKTTQTDQAVVPLPGNSVVSLSCTLGKQSGKVLQTINKTVKLRKRSISAASNDKQQETSSHSQKIRLKKEGDNWQVLEKEKDVEEEFGNPFFSGGHATEDSKLSVSPVPFYNPSQSALHLVEESPDKECEQNPPEPVEQSKEPAAVVSCPRGSRTGGGTDHAVKEDTCENTPSILAPAQSSVQSSSYVPPPQPMDSEDEFVDVEATDESD